MKQAHLGIRNRRLMLRKQQDEIRNTKTHTIYLLFNKIEQ